jgi:hypothetical protein
MDQAFIQQNGGIQALLADAQQQADAYDRAFAANMKSAQQASSYAQLQPLLCSSPANDTLSAALAAAGCAQDEKRAMLEVIQSLHCWAGQPGISGKGSNPSGRATPSGTTSPVPLAMPTFGASNSRNDAINTSQRDREAHKSAEGAAEFAATINAGAKPSGGPTLTGTSNSAGDLLNAVLDTGKQGVLTFENYYPDPVPSIAGISTSRQSSSALFPDPKLDPLQFFKHFKGELQWAKGSGDFSINVYNSDGNAASNGKCIDVNLQLAVTFDNDQTKQDPFPTTIHLPNGEASGVPLHVDFRLAGKPTHADVLPVRVQPCGASQSSDTKTTCDTNDLKARQELTVVMSAARAVRDQLALGLKGVEATLSEHEWAAQDPTSATTEFLTYLDTTGKGAEALLALLATPLSGAAAVLMQVKDVISLVKDGKDVLEFVRGEGADAWGLLLNLPSDISTVATLNNAQAVVKTLEPLKKKLEKVKAMGTFSGSELSVEEFQRAKDTAQDVRQKLRAEIQRIKAALISAQAKLDDADARLRGLPVCSGSVQ